MAPRHAATTALLALCVLAFAPMPATAIVGGSVAPDGAYPWMAAITSGSGSSQYCGGSLVDSTTVVTAAHCMGGLLGIPLVDDVLDLLLFGPSVHVLLGTNDLDSGGESIEATDIYVHPDYDGDHDVAVLKLATPSGQTPIAIAQPGQDSLWGPGILARAAGWGATSEGGSGSNQLRHVDLPMISDADCVQHYGSSVDPATEVCAGWPEGGRDTCQGDSGGPLMVPDGAGGLLLAGLVSWGDGCARPGVPGVYAEVAPLSGFIQSHMGGQAARSADAGPEASPLATLASAPLAQDTAVASLVPGPIQNPSFPSVPRLEIAA
jgi:secreted trypsin-like serine protease